MRLSPGALAAFAGFSIAFAWATAGAQEGGDPDEEGTKPEESEPSEAGRGSSRCTTRRRSLRSRVSAISAARSWSSRTATSTRDRDSRCETGRSPRSP